MTIVLWWAGVIAVPPPPREGEGDLGTPAFAGVDDEGCVTYKTKTNGLEPYHLHFCDRFFAVKFF